MIINEEDLLKKKGNLLKRFLKLTEDALKRAKNKEEEKLTLILEKREKLISEITDVESKLSAIGYVSKNENAQFAEIMFKIDDENKEIWKIINNNFLEIKEDIGKTRKAMKINKAYQSGSGHSIFLNRRN